MRTDELVRILATGAEPVERHAVGRRFAIALGLGAPAAILLMLVLLGLRPDLAAAMRLPMFWVKLAFSGSLAVASLIACMRLARPGRRLGRVPIALALPVIAIWLIAGVALLAAEPHARGELILGATWMVCPWLIALLSLPLLAAGLWAMHGLAPTRLPLAGAALGLLAGSIGALIYCLHCPEVAAPFVGTWYLIGMLIPGLVGGLVGPRLLRW